MDGAAGDNNNNTYTHGLSYTHSPLRSFSRSAVACSSAVYPCWQCKHLSPIMAAISLLCLLAPLASAIQPEARPAVAAPLRDLPWSQLNILHTTDVHGWFGGHLQEYVTSSPRAPLRSKTHNR